MIIKWWGIVSPVFWVAPAGANKPQVKNDVRHQLMAVLPCINHIAMHYYHYINY